MSLTHKITSLLLAVFGLFFTAQLLIHHHVLRPSFDKLERTEAITDVERCRDAITQELGHLSTICNDWANWDDSYQFVQDHNQDFIDNTLTGDVLDNAKLSLIMYIQNDGQVLWADATSSTLSREELLAAFPSERLDPGHFLLQHASLKSDVAGVMLVSGSPLLVVSRPILTSDAEGPQKGTLVMARLLDTDLNALLETRTHVSFRALTPGVAGTALNQTEAMALREHDRVVLRVRDSDMLEVFASIPYMNTASELILRAEVPRYISREGQTALTFAMLMFFITSLAALFTLALVLRVMVLQPLATLSTHAKTTASTHDWTARLNMARTDELGTLANEIDTMVAALAAYHAAAHAMAHDAGRAELAGGAVHDIGNAINSAGVCTHVIFDLLHRSELPKLLKVASKLAELREDHTLLSTEPDSLAHLSQYTTELADLLLQDRDESLQELESLSSHIQRVVQVTQTQMSVVNTGIHTSETSLIEISDMALAVSRSCDQGGRPEVLTTIAACSPVWIDRSKILRVLTTLLPLAAEAVAGNPVEDQRVALTITPVGDTILRFEVIDNGRGYTASDLSLLFRQHQETIESLSAFSLHHCAVSANTMGGTLSAASEGPGRGSTFTLDVPLLRVHRPAEPTLEGASV